MNVSVADAFRQERLGRSATSALVAAAALAFALICWAGFFGHAWPHRTIVLSAGCAFLATLVSASAWMQARRPRARIFARGLLVLCVVIAVRVIGWRTGAGPSSVATFYCVALALVIYGVLQRFAARSGVDGDGERIRLLLIGSIATASILPYITDLLVGDLDGRWYSSVFFDFVDQWRRGVFPVLTGQGQFAYNGVIHLFRSAPFHFYVGGVIDWLTLRQLAPIALEHTTIIFTVMAAGYGMYFGLRSLAPEARWRAAIMAVLFVLCPGALAPIYRPDVYTTFMTIAILPLVVVGNARALRLAPGGFAMLAVGLALLWYCHLPTALRCSLLSFAVQLSGVTTIDGIRRRWKPVLLAAIGFAGLTAYYFVPMAEVPFRESLPLGRDLLSIFALALAVVGLVGFLDRLRWPWLAAGLAGLAVLWVTDMGWCLWGLLGLAVALAGGLGIQASKPESQKWRWELLVAAFTVTAIALALLLPGSERCGSQSVIWALAQDHERLGAALRPIRIGGHHGWPEFQLGWSLLLAALATIGLAFWRRRDDLRWLVVPLVLAGAFQFCLPWLSEFYAAFFPPSMADTIGLARPEREFPTLAAFAALGGFLTIASARSRRALRGITGLLLAGLLWSGYECRAFYVRAGESTLSRAGTEKLFTPENVVMFGYSYELVHVPRYVTTGRVDWRLQTRLFADDGSLLIGPRQIAMRMDAPGARSAEFRLVPHPGHPDIFHLEPAVQVPAHETILAVFDRDGPIRHGQFRLAGERLVSAGMLETPWLAEMDEFAAQDGVVSITNSGPTPEKVEITLLGLGAHPEVRVDAVLKARMVPYDDIRNPLRLISLVPYRVAVKAPTDSVLETPKIYVPGYRAWVDGAPATPFSSREKLVAIRVPAGEHEVRLTYVGTWALWASFAVTLLTSIAGAVFWIRRTW